MGVSGAKSGGSDGGGWPAERPGEWSGGRAVVERHGTADLRGREKGGGGGSERGMKAATSSESGGVRAAAG